jgi:hypothetical protein
MSKFILTLSLAANLLVGIWCVSRWQAGSGANPAGAASGYPQTRTSAVSPTTASAIEAGIGELQNGDVADFTRRLRGGGMPAYVVRAIVKFAIHERYAKLRMELRKGQPVAPFWSNDFGAMAALGADPAAREELAKLEQAERDAIRQAVGVDATDYRIDEIASVRRFLGDVSPDVAAVCCVTFLEKMHQLYPKMVGADSDTRKMMADRLRSEVREKMAGLLTPQQLAEFDYRNDEDLRRKLRTFRPTEDEFQALSQIYRQNKGAGGDQTASTAGSDGQVALGAQIAPALGADRFEDFKMATNPQLESYNVFVARMGLPLSTGAKLSSIYDDFRQSTAQLTAQKVPPSQIPDRYEELMRNANASVTQLLGEAGASAYKKSLGYWLTASPWLREPKK